MQRIEETVNYADGYPEDADTYEEIEFVGGRKNKLLRGEVFER